MICIQHHISSSTRGCSARNFHRCCGPLWPCMCLSRPLMDLVSCSPCMCHPLTHLPGADTYARPRGTHTSAIPRPNNTHHWVPRSRNVSHKCRAEWPHVYTQPSRSLAAFRSRCGLSVAANVKLFVDCLNSAIPWKVLPIESSLAYYPCHSIQLRQSMAWWIQVVLMIFTSL